MELKQNSSSNFNVVPPGQHAVVEIHTIENNSGTRMLISNLGAAAISLFVKDRTGKLEDVLLGYDSANKYLSDEVYMGTVVGRYANRISGDTVVIDQKSYKLHTREGGYHLHGGETGFNKKIFKVLPFSNARSSGLVLTYTSPHLEEGFPGELALQVVYTLTDADEWVIEYTAHSDRTTLINLTQHAYFNLSANPSTSIVDHELQVNADYYLPVNKMQVPTGQLMPVDNTVFDFRAFQKIGGRINYNDPQLIISNGYDHSYVLEKQHTQRLKHAATVCENDSRRKMEVYTTEPAVHFYSGNFLHDVPGKEGIIYSSRAGFCLETQHFPDAPRHPHFPSTILTAGKKWFSKTVFKFSIEE